MRTSHVGLGHERRSKRRYRVTTTLFSGLLSVLGACATVDSTGDFDRARSLVADRTGVQEFYDPSVNERVDEMVSDLLADGLTIVEAVRVAMLNNREFQSLVAEIGASRADVVQSTLLTNPTLSLGLQFPEGGGLADVTVGFAQQLADLWQIPVRKRIAEAELERTILTVGQRAVDLAADVRIRCYRVLALRQAVSYAEENVRLVQRAVDLSETQFRVGEVSGFDVNLARIGAIDVQEELIAARGQLEQARSDVAQALGLSMRPQEVRLTDALPTAPMDIPAEDELLDRALEDRFDIRVAYFGVQRAEAALLLECRKLLPDVQLGLAFERGEQRALPGRKILADTARASIASGKPTAPAIQSRGERAREKSQIIDAKLGPTLALTLPIFDQNQAQIAKAEVRVIQARKEYEAKADSVAADLQRAATAARTAAELWRFQQTQGLPQAEATVAGAEARYQAGEESILAVIEAQDALVKRRRSYVNTLRDYAVAMAQLEGALGGGSITDQAPTSSTEASPPLNEEL